MPASSRRLPTSLEGLGLVAAGAVGGALLRWGLSEGAAAQMIGAASATLLANLLGSLLLGVLVGLQPLRPRLMLALGVGFCGSLTTFSTWIAELQGLLQRHRSGAALLLLAVSVGGGLAVAALGFLLGRHGGRFRR